MQRFWENGSGHSGECPHVRKMLQVLSTRLNLEVLDQLAEGPRNVSTIATRLNLDRPPISRALKKMHGFSMVEVKRVKRSHIYSLGSGIDVITEDHCLHVTAKTRDGGTVSVVIPRSMHVNGQRIR